MAVKTNFMSSLRSVSNSGGNQVEKSSIEVESQKKMFTKNITSDGNLELTAELRRQILSLRDVLDLSPVVEGTVSTPKLLTTTVEDLYKAYPDIVSKLPISDIIGASTKQGLAYFWTALISIGDSWTKGQEWRANIMSVVHYEHEKIDQEKLIGDVLQTLECIIKLAKMKFDVMELEETGRMKSMAIDIVLKKRPSGTCSGGSSGGSSPISPASVLPELPDNSNDDLFGGFMMQSGDKYTLQRVNKTGADEPPADKKVKLDLDDAVQGTYEKLCETLDVIGERNDLTTLKLRAAKQWLEKSMSHPELSALASPVQPLKIPSKPLPETLEPPPKPIELPSVDSTLSVSAQPATASPILLPQLFPLLSPLPPTNAEVQSISNEVPPQSPQASFVSSIAPPPVTSDLNVIAAPSPLPSSPKSAQLPPTLSTLRSPLPPSPMISSKGFPPLPPMPSTNGAAPPPPPSLGGGTLGQRSASKLKRSSQMGNLYRLLKGKVEGPSLNGKSTRGRRSKVRSGTSGKQGMADALAEITKRSPHFQQIEEDVRKYEKTITELKSTITGFQTKDMAELVKFHKQVESHLDNLTDESQVLARFEGFPTKKLEHLRMAAALYSKLDSIHTTIKNWKIVPRMSELLVKVDTYFTKIKGEVDAIERTKDEELKKLESHNIHFDFNILVKIKESMVDLSSGCVELALKESRDAKLSSNITNKGPKKGSDKPAKLLWKTFQLAYRVYTFAGGQDDRAERLTRELAHEIETEPEIQNPTMNSKKT